MQNLTKIQKESLVIPKMILAITFPEESGIAMHWTTRACKLEFTGYSIKFSAEIFKYLTCNA
jgi:hypothetical protein